MAYYIVYQNNSGYTLTLQKGPASAVAISENQASYLVSSIKEQVRLCSTVPINLLVATTSLDGVALANGDRVLLTTQRKSPENGLYFWDEGLQLFSRSEDGWDLPSGFLVSVTEGEIENDTLWMFSTDGPVEIGVTPLNFVRLTSESSHALSHQYSGGDPINGDLLSLDYSPSNYTPNPVGLATDVHHLTAHLTGIDTALLGMGIAPHAATHIRGSGDEIEGDVLDISYTPTYYTPDTTPLVVSTAQQLTAHLAGIDTAISTITTGAHAASHISGSGDEIDGDQLDIDYTPTNYTPNTSPGEVTTTQQLTAHLAGINAALVSSVDPHATTHISGAGDEIDGDQLDITYTPMNYPQDTTPGEVSTTQQLTAHLAGIDSVLSPISTRTIALDGTVNGSSPNASLGTFAFDPTQYGVGKGFRFEVVMKTNNATKTATALLYNLTDSEMVTGSTLTVSGVTEFTRKISQDFNLGVGAGDLKYEEKLYEVRLSTNAVVIGDVVTLGSASIIISHPTQLPGLVTSSFPTQIQIVMGSLLYGGIPEDTVITLNRISVSRTVALYSEDGTNNPNSTTNRLKLQMRSSTYSTGTYTYDYNDWDASFYWAGTRGYTVTSSQWNTTASIDWMQSSPFISTDYLYTFKDLYYRSTKFGVGWGNLVKSMIGI